MNTIGQLIIGTSRQSLIETLLFFLTNKLDQGKTLQSARVPIVGCARFNMQYASDKRCIA